MKVNEESTTGESKGSERKIAKKVSRVLELPEQIGRNPQI
jgi:hypothetical protein